MYFVRGKIWLFFVVYRLFPVQCLINNFYKLSRLFPRYIENIGIVCVILSLYKMDGYFRVYVGVFSITIEI